MTQKISVIIPSYNSRETIRACVESILNSGYSPLEVIVVDDVSNDDSPEIVEALAQQHPDQVKLIRLDKNGGPSKARNAGARATSSPLLFFVDSDTSMLPGALDLFAKRMQEADAVSGHYHYEPTNSGYCAWYKALLNYQLFSRKGVFEHNVFNGAAAGIRADVFQDLGGFNENLPWGMDYENEEFGHRIAKGHTLLFDPEIMVHHCFPGFVKMTSTYFTRVSLWMELLMKGRNFEAAGNADQGTGLATAAAPAALITLPLAVLWPVAGVIPLVFLGMYIYGYAGFFSFVATKRPLMLPALVLLNLYFNTVITLGAAYGVARNFLGLERAKLNDNGKA